MDMTGVVLDNRYSIIKKLGAGGMAEVFLADNLQQQKQVAVKILPPSNVEESEFVRRFRREFDVCSNLDHPNIVKLYSCGRTPDKSSWYYAMELLDCKDLDELLKERGKLKSSYVMQIVLQLARGFEHYHSKGVVHRDLKPSNIMIEGNGRVVIMDFGLVHDPSMTQLTKTGTIMGTPQYMSPELLSGEKTDPRSDIFQLGSITHECLCGKPAFPGKTVPEVGAKIMFGNYTPIRKVDPSVSANWETFLINCLGTQRTDRYQSAELILKDLQKMMIGDAVEPLITKEAEDSGKTIDLGGSRTSNSQGTNRDSRTSSRAALRQSRIKRSRMGKNGGNREGVTDTDPQIFRSNAGRLGAKTSIERAGDGRVSSASFIDNPDNVKKSRAVIISVTSLVILLVFGSIFYTLFLKTQYDTSNLKIVAGVGTLSVTWKSIEPYESVISISKDGGESRVVNGDSSDASVDHLIDVDDLELNVEYSIQVLYPDSTKGPVKRKRTLKPQIHVKSSKFTGKTLNITWTVEPPGKTKLWVKRKNKGSSTVFDAIASGGVEGVSIEDASEAIEDISFDIEWENGSNYKTSLGEVIVDEVELLCNRLDSFDVEAFQKKNDEIVGTRAGTKLNETLSVKSMDETKAEYDLRRKQEDIAADKARELARAKAKGHIGKELLSFPETASYKRGVLLSPLVLGLSVIEPSKKYRFYEHMRNYVRLYASLLFENTDVAEFKPLPHLGVFQSRPGNSADSRSILKTINLDTSVTKTTPLKLTGNLPTMFRNDSVHKKTLRFNIDSPDQYSRASMYFIVDTWKSTGLKIIVNNRDPVIFAFNRKSLSMTKRRNEDIEIGIPLDLLKSGQNQIEIIQTGLFNRVTKQQIEFEGLFLHLHK